MNDNPTAAWWCHIRETACSVQDLQSKLENIPASVWEYYENDHQAIEVNAEKEKLSTFLFPLLWEDQPVMHAYVGGRTPRTRVLPHHPSYRSLTRIRNVYLAYPATPYNPGTTSVPGPRWTIWTDLRPPVKYPTSPCCPFLCCKLRT